MLSRQADKAFSEGKNDGVAFEKMRKLWKLHAKDK
jgi:hypothetical protein